MKTNKEQLTKYVRLALAMGARRAKIIPVRKVAVGEWVRVKCQYGCSGWGKRYTCPPYSPAPDVTRKMLAEYRIGLLIQRDNIRFKAEPKLRVGFKKMVARLERALFLDGYYKAFGMASGPCRFCRTCDLTRPCRFPDDARPAMEACGIDVYQTCRANGFPLEVVRTYRDTCAYVGLILIE
jgi:predicted metal-binding protein